MLRSRWPTTCPTPTWRSTWTGCAAGTRSTAALYLGGRVHLPGLLLNAKGDRVAMHSSVETRYPFLDEDVFAFLAQLHPRWKLRGLRDKYLLRLLAERWLPKSIAWRRKAMFRAPFDSFHGDRAPPFVDQLLSAESLRKTGYFDAAAVRTLAAGVPGAAAGVAAAHRRSRWAWSACWRRSCGTTRSSTAAWPTCRVQSSKIAVEVSRRLDRVSGKSLIHD